MKTFLKLFTVLFLITGCGHSPENNTQLMAISIDKMNVLYVGVDNPISIAVSGSPSEKIIVKMNEKEGTISGENGKYVVRVSNVGKVDLEVSTEIDGKSMLIGKAEFSCKLVPDPIAIFAGHKMSDKDNTIDTAEVQKAAGLEASIDNFDYDSKFDVVSFDLSTIVNGANNVSDGSGIAVSETSNGALLSAGQKMVLKKAMEVRKVFGRPYRRKIYIENIKVKGPDGSTRTIAPMVLQVK